jgi:hypothetical protein
MHLAGGWRPSYARALARLADRLQRGGLVARACAVIGVAPALAAALIRARSEPAHAAWVFTARKRDVDDA